MSRLLQMSAWGLLVSVVGCTNTGPARQPAFLPPVRAESDRRPALLIVREKAGYGGRNDRYIDLRVEDDLEPIKQKAEDSGKP